MYNCGGGVETHDDDDDDEEIISGVTRGRASRPG